MCLWGSLPLMSRVHQIETAGAPEPNKSDLRHDWRRGEILELFELPFADLIFKAATLHRRYFDPNEVQLSQLLSIKTGGCPEDCAYCPQAARYATGVEAEKLMPTAAVLDQADVEGIDLVRRELLFEDHVRLLRRRLLRHQPEAVRDALHVRVDGQGGASEREEQHAGRRLWPLAERCWSGHESGG